MDHKIRRENILNTYIKKSFILVILIALSVPLFADQDAEIGKQLVSKYSSAVVTVQIVSSTTMSFAGMGENKEEMKNEITGTVIDSSGLIVTSLSATSPVETIFSKIIDNDKINVVSQITGIKIIMGNSTEIPGRIVLRDKDLDLLFIRPKTKPAKPMTAIDFKNSAKLNQFDQLVILYRLGNSVNRQIAGVFDRIQAILQKPQTQYLVGANAMDASLGAPVFTIKGQISGLLLLRSQPKGISDISGTFGGLSSGGMMYIALPAEEIVNAAKQAPAQ